MQLFHAGSKMPSASNTIVCTNLNTTENLAGVARQMPKSTCPDWKSRKANHALIRSNVPTARKTIKLILISVPFGGTVSIENGT